METAAVFIWVLLTVWSIIWAATYAIKTPNETVERMRNGK
jgi:hypothetical protein